MSKLITTLNLAQHDDLYAQMVDMFEHVSEQDSLKAMAKLVLLLANHIGDEQVVAEAVTAVRGSPLARSGEHHA